MSDLYHILPSSDNNIIRSQSGFYANLAQFLPTHFGLDPEKMLIATLGDGDVCIARCKSEDTQATTGIGLHPNPNGQAPVGTRYPELFGENIACIDDTAIIIYFRSKEDIDKFIADLQEIRKSFTD